MQFHLIFDAEKCLKKLEIQDFNISIWFIFHAQINWLVLLCLLCHKGSKEGFSGLYFCNSAISVLNIDPYKTLCAPWGNLLMMWRQKLYIPSTINTDYMLWHAKWVSCAWAYFNTKKYIFEPKLAGFLTFRLVNFVIANLPKNKKVVDSFELL